MEANYKEQFKVIKRRVYCITTTALDKGTALVYDYTNGTATTEDRSRGKTVEVPSASNSQYFAGVLLADKPTGARWVDIAVPGSDLLIYLEDSSATIGDIVYFDCGDNAGQFAAGGIGIGNGAAKILKTVAVAGLVHAKLLEGAETGGVQLITPAAAGGAITLSLTGRTLINGGTVNDAHITNTLANGTFVGQRKAVKITTLIGNSKDFVLTTTTAVQLNGTSALATITFNAANEESILEWMGPHWKLLANSGATLA